MSIKNNTTNLQSLLEQVNALPEAGGVALPTLSNEGTAADMLNGKQLINSDGKIVTGTIPSQDTKTITPTESSQTAVAKNVYTTGAVTVGAIPDGYLVGDEISVQDTLITELETVLTSKTSGGSGGGNVDTCTVTINTTTLVIGDVYYTGVDSNNNITCEHIDVYSSHTQKTFTALCNSNVFIINKNYSSSYNNLLEIGNQNCNCVCSLTSVLVYELTANANQSAHIEIATDTGAGGGGAD